MNSYHNTTSEPIQNEIEFEEKAQFQDQRVLQIMRKQNRPMTAFQVHSFFPGNVPITSIRRAITNLYNEGVLEKGDLVMERYGRRNYQYFIK